MTRSAETEFEALRGFLAGLAYRMLGSVAEAEDIDAVLYADGGGKRPAALEPIRGRQAIAELFASVAARGLMRRDQLERASINGAPGFIVHAADGISTLAFEYEGDRIVAMYTVRNPDKLRHLAS